MQPFFSVIIPLYNKEKYISKTLETVLNQSFQDFEVIVINDGSTDNSKAIVDNYDDSRISIFSKENKGLSHTKNYGIQQANGTYMAFLDADDLWNDRYLETCFSQIESHPDFKVFATNYNLFWPKKHVELTKKDNKISEYKSISRYTDIIKYPISQSSFIVHKSVFEKAGYFDDSINYGEDEDYYIRCLKHFKISYNPNPLIFYRLGIDNQMTQPNTSFIKRIPDFDKYLLDSDDTDLKKYIDFIHYKLLVLFKAERNTEMVKFYKKKINPSNLNTIHRIKYHLPISIFNFLKQKKSYFSIISIHCCIMFSFLNGKS